MSGSTSASPSRSASDLAQSHIQLSALNVAQSSHFGRVARRLEAETQRANRLAVELAAQRQLNDDVQRERSNLSRENAALRSATATVADELDDLQHSESSNKAWSAGRRGGADHRDAEIENMTKAHQREVDALRLQLDDAERRARLLELSTSRSGGVSGHNHGPFQSRLNNDDIDRLMKRFDNASSRTFVAKYRYRPTSPQRSVMVDWERLSEVGCRAGDVVSVESEVRADGYYVATVRGQRGLIPQAYVEPLRLADERARPDVINLLAMAPSNVC